MKPTYESLTKQDLLEGCLGGYTQNNCESLNHLIWARCPKTIASGRDFLDSAAASAVLAFNDGNMVISSISKGLGIEPGHNTMSALSKLDKNRESVRATKKRLTSTRRSGGPKESPSRQERRKQWKQNAFLMNLVHSRDCTC